MVEQANPGLAKGRKFQIPGKIASLKAKPLGGTFTVAYVHANKTKRPTTERDREGSLTDIFFPSSCFSEDQNNWGGGSFSYPHECEDACQDFSSVS